MTVAVRVIPCLDVDAGRVVKGVNFRELRDAGDPVEMARVYDAEGADELVFLDITASSGDRATTYDIVTRTAEQVFIPLTVGGECAVSTTSTACSARERTRSASTPPPSRVPRCSGSARSASVPSASCCPPTPAACRKARTPRRAGSRSPRTADVA